MGAEVPEMSRNQSEVSERLKRTIVRRHDHYFSFGISNDVMTKRPAAATDEETAFFVFEWRRMSVTHRVSTSHENLTMKAKPRLQLCPRLVVFRRPKQLYMPESSLRAASPWHWIAISRFFLRLTSESSDFASESLAFAAAKGIPYFLILV